MKTFKQYLLESQRKVFTGKNLEKFKSYYRSISELKELLDGKSITLQNIIKLYANEYQAPADNVVYDLAVDEIDDVKEYNRTKEDGNLYPEEWDNLKADIKKNGIQNEGVIEMRRLKDGNIQVYLGEGNHRLAIAKELGLKTMPIRFYIV